MNVVFILVDGLGWSDLACYGGDLHETPHIDRLAQQGMRFSNAYAAASICSPTRASILTGKYPARLGMTIWHEWAVRGPQRHRKWKLLEFFEDNRVELYNLEEDLSESNNLATAMPDMAARLRADLHTWRKQVKAQVPRPNPDYLPQTAK